jgi:hypothetical protein
MRAVILGAGASKAYDQSPSGVRMPIARDFFSTFNRMEIAANPWVLWGKTINFLRDSRGLNNYEAYLAADLDIEAIASEIGFQIADPAIEQFEKIQLYGLYWELVSLFACVVNSIASGPVSQPHLDLARMLELGDTVITFNWDTLMERALMATGRWAVDDGYSVTPTSVFRDGWSKPLKGSSSFVPILKLHGSANWITAFSLLEQQKLVLAHTLAPEALFIFEQATKPYSCYAGRYMAGYEPLTFGYYPPNLDEIGRSAPEGMVNMTVRPKIPWIPEGAAPDDGLVSMPLLIAPERFKQYDYYGGLFASLWDKAEGALAEADELVIIGYSFPPTDTRTRTLFKRAFIRRKNIPKVILVDPSPARAIEAITVDFGIPHSSLSVRAEPFTGTGSIT